MCGVWVTGWLGRAPYPLGRLPIGLVAEACLQAGVDRLQVDPQGGQQLAVARLRAREDSLVDQVVDLGPDRLQVQAVGDQDPSGQVVALKEQPEQEVLGTKVVVAQPPSLHPGPGGGGAGRLGGIHRPGDRLHRGFPISLAWCGCEGRVFGGRPAW
jgi:hypothetical protein